MHSTPRILTWLGRLAMVGFLGARAPVAQADPATELVFRGIQASVEGQDHRLVQIRRVRGYFSGLGRGGEWVGAVETVLHRGAAANVTERFALDLLCFEGVAMTQPQLAHRQRIYRGQADYLYRYQSFRVFDPARAAAHYVMHDLGVGTLRAGRPCHRVAIVSRTVDRPSWILDLDRTNLYPLYAGEFSPTAGLVAELEVLHADYGSAAQIPAGDAWAWSPRMGVELFGSVGDASQRIANLAAVPVEGSDVGSGYVLHHARVLTDPLTAERSLVGVYHDGVDSLFVTQRPRPVQEDEGHVARFFSEAGVLQCQFQHKATELMVVGRNVGLRAIVQRIYRIAVATL